MLLGTGLIEQPGQLLCEPFLLSGEGEGSGAVFSFLGRRGGTSSGPFASLNLSFEVGDDPGSVEANWRIVRSAFPQVRRWVTMRQVHGAKVETVHELSAERLGPCDAMVTDLPGVALCVLTADCVPVLLAAADGRAVAAVHAGWRGTVADASGNAVRELTRRFSVAPAEMHAAIGPSIGPCCYSVCAEVMELVRAVRLEQFCAGPDEAGVFRLDLRAMNRELLLRCGVAPERIVLSDLCTACRAGDFFSHRRSAGRTGRQLSWIARLPQEAALLGAGSSTR